MFFVWKIILVILAFDSVSHNKLLFKLENMGITGPLLALLKDYLTICKVVKSDAFLSSSKSIFKVVHSTFLFCYLVTFFFRVTE